MSADTSSGPTTPAGAFWSTNAGRQSLRIIVVVVAVIVALVAFRSTSSGSTTSGEIFLDQATTTGANAFTPSEALNTALGAATTTTNATTTTQPNVVPTVSGATVGLYGGTLNLSTCNAQQMITYLTSRPSLGQAWASVEGIPFSQLGAYISSLTPVILRGDTRVTNHSYANGVAIPEQSILQAGTAVLVDAYGVPRARCYCGNPLLPPFALHVTPTYVGPHWPTFVPTTVVVVVPAPAPQTIIVIVDTNTGQLINRPVGTDGGGDTPYTPGGTPSGTTTTTTTQPGPGESPGTKQYVISFSNPTFSGTPVLFSASDCNSSLTQDLTGGAAQGVGINQALITIEIVGDTIDIRAKNGSLKGTYDPSNGSFVTKYVFPSPDPGISLTGAFDGTLAQSGGIVAGYSVVVSPPPAACTFNITGQRYFVP